LGEIRDGVEELGCREGGAVDEVAQRDARCLVVAVAVGEGRMSRAPWIFGGGLGVMVRR
jgi:hypothetical protein